MNIFLNKKILIYGLGKTGRSALEFLKKELNHQMSSILLPKNFTLPQLQKLYENVLDKKIDKRNFRKQILKEKRR